MLAHVRAAYPREGCGLLAGRDGEICRWFPGTNVHPEPLVRYRMDDRELLTAFREMERNGWDLLAIFHSHPQGPAYPSPTDIAQAYYPGSLYLICSLARPEAPELRGFWIVDGQVREHPVEVI